MGVAMYYISDEGAFIDGVMGARDISDEEWKALPAETRARIEASPRVWSKSKPGVGPSAPVPATPSAAGDTGPDGTA